MINVKTNLEPFIDWFGYTLRFKDGYSFIHFVKLMSMYNPEYLKGGVIQIDGINFLDRQDYLKIEFTASFFKNSCKVKDDLKSIEKWLGWFYKIPDLYNIFDKSTISRIDLSCNDYNHTFESKFKLNIKRKQEVTRFYKDNNRLKGIAIGKRGKNFVWYKVYDKREDTKEAQNKAIARFGTFSFIRHEFEIGRKFLRERNIGFKTDFEALFLALVDNKFCDFGYDFGGNKKVFYRIAKVKSDHKRMMKQVLGITRNHLLNHRAELIEKINEL